MYDNEATRAAYAEHLSQHSWDFYSTVTFRRLRRDPFAACAAVWSVLEKFDASRAFMAVERHKLDGVHVHTLHRHVFRGHVRPASLWRYMYKAFGRTTVESPHDGTAAAVYCSKYVTKGKESGDSFHYFGTADAWTLDR